MTFFFSHLVFVVLSLLFRDTLLSNPSPEVCREAVHSHKQYYFNMYFTHPHKTIMPAPLPEMCGEHLTEDMRKDIVMFLRGISKVQGWSVLGPGKDCHDLFFDLVKDFEAGRFGSESEEIERRKY